MLKLGEMLKNIHNNTPKTDVAPWTGLDWITGVSKEHLNTVNEINCTANLVQPAAKGKLTN